MGNKSLCILTFFLCEQLTGDPVPYSRGELREAKLPSLKPLRPLKVCRDGQIRVPAAEIGQPRLLCCVLAMPDRDPQNGPAVDRRGTRARGHGSRLVQEEIEHGFAQALYSGLLCQNCIIAHHIQFFLEPL